MIDYSVLARAVDFYEKRGFQRIETPWLVSPGIADITKPGDRPHYIIKRETQDTEKAFVASGEQGFLYLINKGHLPSKGKFQTITPCIRPDAFGVRHTKYFMKLELIEYDVDGIQGDHHMAVVRMRDHAWSFFKTEIPERHWDKMNDVVTGPLSGDIDLNGIEIGSYGFRQCEFVTWVYGTGVAEPRFSRTLKTIK